MDVLSSISSMFSSIKGFSDQGDKGTAAPTKGADKANAKKPDTKSAGKETADANGMNLIGQATGMMTSNVEGCKGQLEANVAQSTESGKNAAEQVKGDGSKKNAKPAPATPSAAMPNPMMGA